MRTGAIRNTVVAKKLVNMYFLMYLVKWNWFFNPDLNCRGDKIIHIHSFNWKKILGNTFKKMTSYILDLYVRAASFCGLCSLWPQRKGMASVVSWSRTRIACFFFTRKRTRDQIPALMMKCHSFTDES